MTLRSLNAEAFEGAIHSSKLTLVDFSAAWCPPCRTLLPILEQLAEEEGEAADIYSVDVDASPELAERFGVLSMPTVFAFKDGEALEKLVGLRPKPAYQAVIRRHA
ncbi:thioredoxin family protein [Paenibacillus sp.]|uniref:thioredoxin family protein n=1 Tax=Paenibacillus sp. TaxID=58172 RepID=UPI002D6F523D|nr:thioredoxin family protein [Paenibacillus sp.]HZG86747.1 thioredoxin family protein [Paenibacillus sp.]